MESDYTFPAGSSLAPGAYLVLSADAAWYSGAYWSAAFGQFSGTLANNGERVRLEDNFGNLADEVDYNIGGAMA